MWWRGRIANLEGLIRHDRPIPPTRTTDRTAYWLSISLQAGIWAFCALVGVDATRGPLRAVFAVAALVALAFTVPGLWSLWGVAADRRAAALAARAIADARVGEDSPMGKLLARWSVLQGDVDAYLAARERTRRMSAAAVAIGIVVLTVHHTLDLESHSSGAPPWDPLWFGASAAALVVTGIVWQVAARAAVARAESAPLAVIVCEDGVGFAGDVTWWRGAHRLVSARVFGAHSLEVVSTHATLDLKRPDGNDWLATKRQGPSLRFERDVLTLPVTQGAWAAATEAARLLRERHGLASEDDAVAGDDLFGTR